MPVHSWSLAPRLVANYICACGWQLWCENKRCTTCQALDTNLRKRLWSDSGLEGQTFCRNKIELEVQRTHSWHPCARVWGKRPQQISTPNATQTIACTCNCNTNPIWQCQPKWQQLHHHHSHKPKSKGSRRWWVPLHSTAEPWIQP